MCGERRGARRTAGFTLAEVLIAAVLCLLIMAIPVAMMMASHKEHLELGGDLAVNEKVSLAFDKLGKDVREASFVEYPFPVLPERAPPAFNHVNPLQSTGCLVLLLERPAVNLTGDGIDSVKERILYYLDKPRKLGVDRNGRDVTIYTLFRRRQAPGTGAAGSTASTTGTSSTTATTVETDETKAVLDGLEEVVFYRSMRDPSRPDGVQGSGSAVVHVRVKATQPRLRADRRLDEGYAAILETAFTLRGSDITGWKTLQAGQPP
jgi:hypothetical protein